MTSIRPATAADAAGIAQAMGDAFASDPVASWFWRNPRRRQERLTGWYALLADQHYLEHGHVFVAEEDGEVVGCSMWSSPAGWQFSPAAELRLARYALPRLGRHLPLAFVAMGAIERRHPTVPHWYLAELGVRRSRQGAGIGSRLMFDVLGACDRDAIPAYLASSTEGSRALYERHGFRVQEVMHLPRAGPPLWLMWREPRAPHARS